MVDDLRHPARLLAACGVGIMAGAAFLPWVTTVDTFGVLLVLGGFDRAGDGLIELGVGAGLLAVVASRGARTSGLRTLQLLPALLGTVAFFISLDALRTAQAHLDTIRQQGGHGQLEPGLWLLVLGAVVTACGGIAVSVVVSRAHPPPRDPSLPPVLGRGAVAHSAVGVAGFLVGAGVGLALPAALLGSSPTQGFASLYGGVIGAFVGTGLALFAWRRLDPRRDTGRRR